MIETPIERPDAPASRDAGNASARTSGAGRSRRERWAAWLAALYLVSVLVLWALDVTGPERFWWSTVILYSPRWALIVPALPLTGMTLAWTRKWTVATVSAAAIVVGPVMGLQWSAGAAGGTDVASGSPARIRVMTYNVAGKLNPAAVAEVLRTNPDIAVFQEVRETAETAQALFPGYHTAGPAAGYFIASHYPIIEMQSRVLPNAPFWRRTLHCRIDVAGTPVSVVDLHLDTPRSGLSELKRGRLFAAINDIERDFGQRLERASAAADEIGRESGPVLVAGDFNAPVSSLVFRPFLKRGLSDAFSTVGRGYGYSYGHRLRPGQSFIRIDHILGNSRIGFSRCWTGGPEGSDHRPVIAELSVLP